MTEAYQPLERMTQKWPLQQRLLRRGGKSGDAIANQALKQSQFTPGIGHTIFTFLDYFCPTV